MIPHMHHRTIPIEVVPTLQATPAVAPLLKGDAAVLQKVLDALERAVGAELGASVPIGTWLRELRIDANEATIAMAPGLRELAPEIAQIAFDTLRSQLPDTDIFLGAACS